MKYLVLLSILVLSCKKNTTPLISMPVEKYKLVKFQDENLAKLIKSYKRANNEFVINFNNGEFKGIFEKINFKGKYDIKKVSSGFSNGFNYEVELAFLSKDVSSSTIVDAYFSDLISTTKIFVSPNKLNQPDYMVLKMGNKTKSDNLKLIMTL